MYKQNLLKADIIQQRSPIPLVFLKALLELENGKLYKPIPNFRSLLLDKGNKNSDRFIV